MGGGESSRTSHNPTIKYNTNQGKGRRRKGHNGENSAPSSADTSPVGPAQSQLAPDSSPSTLIEQRHNPFQPLAAPSASDTQPTNLNTETGVDNMDTATDKKPTETGTRDAKVTADEKVAAAQAYTQLVANATDLINRFEAYFAFEKPLSALAAESTAKKTADFAKSTASFVSFGAFGGSSSANEAQGKYAGFDEVWTYNFNNLYRPLIEKLLKTDVDEEKDREALLTEAERIDKLNRVGSNRFPALTKELVANLKAALQAEDKGKRYVAAMQKHLTPIANTTSSVEDAVKFGKMTPASNALEAKKDGYPATQTKDNPNAANLAEAKISLLRLELFKHELAAKDNVVANRPEALDIIHILHEGLTVLREIYHEIAPSDAYAKFALTVRKTTTQLETHDKDKDNADELNNIGKVVTKLCEEVNAQLNKIAPSNHPFDPTLTKNLLKELGNTANSDYTQNMLSQRAKDVLGSKKNGFSQ